MLPDHGAPLAAQPTRGGKTPASPPGTALMALLGFSSIV